MLTAGVYFQYESAHRCKTEFDTSISTYEELNQSALLQSITPDPPSVGKGCKLVRSSWVISKQAVYCSKFSLSTKNTTENIVKAITQQTVITQPFGKKMKFV